MSHHRGGPAGPDWRLPAGLLLGAFLALLDVSIVTVALPDIGADLNAGTSGMQWVVDAYTLLLSALLLSSGAVGDRYGRKRAYLTGVAVFTVASLGCALAPTAGVLIAARAVQGAGAALIFTGTLSNLVQAYPQPQARARMLGLQGAVGGAAVLAGPLLGGVLVDTVGWRGVFLINLPVGAVTLWLALRAVPESSDPQHAALDPVGQVLALAGLGALTYGLIESGAHGWTSAWTIGSLGGGVVALVAFFAVERASRRPMLPTGLFRDGSFTVPNAASFVLGFGTSAVFFLLSLYLQQVRGYSALGTGLRFLPLTVAIWLVAPYATRLCARYGTARIMSVGYTVSGAALMGLTLLGTDTGFGVFAALTVALGAGMGASIGPTQLAGVAALPVQRSGLASACISTTRQLGTAMGVAVLGLVIAEQAGTDSARPGYADGFMRGLHLSGLAAGAATLAAAALVGVHGRAKAAAAPAPATAADARR
ncbi:MULTISPECIES: MFS transporter [unclassified Streptomyces]|uniref:MFS transporter n=1 Tax=unclassified Streptomyces TaxID=2593676 RepID=UPI000DD6CE1D|nr:MULTISPECIES: MFS transporter [unclassified Streptomyces]QZZ25056.1 MFS transporter [Streptomyces sp. ST1015]